MIQADYINYPLHFHLPAGTSRGVLHKKDCWFIRLRADDGTSGWGEVSFIPGLSVEDGGEMEIRLDHVCKLISRGEMEPDQPLPGSPGIRFALETALMELNQGGNGILFPSDFTRGLSGIPTNGLIWMGEREFLLEQIRTRVEMGYRVLKMKVGALDFLEEIMVLEWIRKEFGTDDLEVRLDANGAWKPEDAQGRLESLVSFGIHSIEQPIAAGQPDALAQLCNNPLIPIALDEELIGVEKADRQSLLKKIKPQYIILKPGLLGGFSEADNWINLAHELDTGWWVTSALESNIGLNAIAQWTFQLGVSIPQGLGTGQLYQNNIPSPLELKGDQLWFSSELPWDLTSINI